jgi:hypothetical protein
VYSQRGLCGSSGCKTDDGKDAIVFNCGKNPSFKNRKKICSYVFANIYMEHRNGLIRSGPIDSVFGLERQWLELLPDYSEDFYITTVNSTYTLSRKEFGEIFCHE